MDGIGIECIWQTINCYWMEEVQLSRMLKITPETYTICTSQNLMYEGTFDLEWMPVSVIWAFKWFRMFSMTCQDTIFIWNCKMIWVWVKNPTTFTYARGVCWLELLKYFQKCTKNVHHLDSLNAFAYARNYSASKERSKISVYIP